MGDVGRMGRTAPVRAASCPLVESSFPLSGPSNGRIAPACVCVCVCVRVCVHTCVCAYAIVGRGSVHIFMSGACARVLMC